MKKSDSKELQNLLDNLKLSIKKELKLNINGKTFFLKR
jgi:hypothetical protein